MPAESVSAAGERFARDMRRIREARDVTQDDIHEEKRIAITLITAFEQDGLFEHPAFNRVYLRSFVRAYADCIDIDPELALSHLERALKGEYEDELAANILEARPSMGGVAVDQIEEPDEEDIEEKPSTVLGRPLSRQEREPQRFTPRPIGSEAEETPGGSTPPVDARDEPTAEERAAESTTQKTEGQKTEGQKAETQEAEAVEATGSEDETGATEKGAAISKEKRERETSADPKVDSAAQVEDDATDIDQKGTVRDDDTMPAPDEKPGVSTGETSEEDTGATHIADSSVGTTEQARLDTGAVFGKRPLTSDPSEEANGEEVDEEEKRQIEKELDHKEEALDHEEEDSTGTTSVDHAAYDAASQPEESSNDASDDGPTLAQKEDSANGRTSEDDPEKPEASPADRFRAASSADPDGPPPPAHGEMIGEPQPVGADTDTVTSGAAASGSRSRSSDEPPAASRPDRDRAERGIGTRDSLPDTSTLLIGAGIVIGSILIGTVIWFLVAGDGESPQPTAERTETTSGSPAAEPDTGATAESAAQGASAQEPSTQEPLANLVLGDTLRLVVQANTNISGIRIQRDSDLRRPYWINGGETMAFPFTERVIVWDQLDSVDLYLEDYRYLASDHIDDEGKVVITRDSARAFANTVRGQAATLPAPTVKPLITASPDTTAPAGN